MMSGASELKVVGRPTYQQNNSSDKMPQPSNKCGNDKNSAQNKGNFQSKVQDGSPQFSKNIDFNTLEKAESPEKEFLTTPEDPSIISKDAPITDMDFSISFKKSSTIFKDTSTTFKDTSTGFQNTSTAYMGPFNSCKDSFSASKVLSSPKSSSKICKDASPANKGFSSVRNTTSKNYTRSSTTHNLPDGNKQLPLANTLDSFEQINTNSGIRWFISVVLIIAVASVTYAIPKALPSDQNLLPSKRICTFEDLKSKYQKQDNNLWKSLRVQIESILNGDPAVPSVFLFLYTNRSTEELVWMIAKTASTCFDPSLEPMKLDNNDFTSQASVEDYGVIIKKYKEQVADGGALVVANLNEIPGRAARALHAICDTYSPIIDRVVIFMTLRVLNEVGNPIEVAENTLNEIWGASIMRHELDPLITRVTEQVFYLSNEN